MAFDAHKNFAYSTVATAPSPASSGASLIVQTGDGAKFPATPFNATVWPVGTQPLTSNAEIVRVTNISGDTLTITRTQESTAARSILIGDQIANTITAKALTDIEGAAGGDTLNTVASSGSTQTINYATADVWDITLTANCTFTLSGFTNGKPNYLTLVLRQDGTGSRTVTWPAITWIGSGVAPILQTAPSSVDSVVLFSFDGGSTVFGIAQTSSSGLKSGTSFPGSPSDGDLFYRTDRKIQYEYDSTSTNWLSLDRKYVPLIPSTVFDASTATGTYGVGAVFEDIYIERWISLTSVSVTNNGSNFYTFTLDKQNAAGANTSITSFSTSADTVGNNALHNVSVAATVSAASFPCIVVIVTKTGTPGNHFLTSMLVARSVG